MTDPQYDSLGDPIFLSEKYCVFELLGEEGSVFSCVSLGKKQEITTLGTIKYYVRTHRFVYMAPKLYFFVTKVPEGSGTEWAMYEEEHFENVLICINLETMEIEEINHPDGSLYGIDTYRFGREIVTLKNILHEDTIETFVESYNLDTGEWSKRFTCSIDKDMTNGEGLYGICTNEENLYLLYDTKTDGNAQSFILILDKEYHETNRIAIPKDLQTGVLTARIMNMQAWNGFLFLQNFSRKGYLARIENGGLTKIMEGEEFFCLPNVESEPPVLYYVKTNKLYVLQREGDLIVKNVQVKDNQGYGIHYALLNGQRCYLRYRNFAASEVENQDFVEFLYTITDESSVELVL